MGQISWGRLGDIPDERPPPRMLLGLAIDPPRGRVNCVGSPVSSATPENNRDKMNQVFAAKCGSLLIALATVASTTVAATDPLRVLIETDAPGGDPDDEGSLVRFFLYLNEWDVEGIYCTRRADQARNGESGQACLNRFIAAYEKVWPTLRTHDARYPSPEHLRSITYPAYEGTAARDAIVATVDREDPRRVWYVNWGTNDGNLTAMRQALDHVKRTRSSAAYRAFVDRLCFSRDADRGYHVREHIPHLHLWVDTRNPDRWYHRFRPLTATAGGFDIDRDVKTGHGQLGSYYTIQKEGDTPGFLYLVPNGLSDAFSPSSGSWAGRFVPRTDEHRRDGFYWSAAQDKLGETTSRDNTLRRWATHIQNDFKARMDWCVREYEDANHPPAVVVNGVAGMKPLSVLASPGQQVELSAEGSTDADGDGLQFTWFSYPEAGTYGKVVAIDNSDQVNTSLAVPQDSSGKSIHVVLQVTDEGEPALTRYRRVVIDCR